LTAHIGLATFKHKCLRVNAEYKHTFKRPSNENTNIKPSKLYNLANNKATCLFYNLRSLEKVCGNNDPHNSQNMSCTHL
jgi:hypothetical protein